MLDASCEMDLLCRQVVLSVSSRGCLIFVRVEKRMKFFNGKKFLDHSDSNDTTSI